MQTYNSFNELAAGQQTLHSDMSVFNDARDDRRRAIDADEALEKAQRMLEQVPLGTEQDAPYRWTDDFDELQQRLMEMRKKLQTAYEFRRKSGSPS